jgi:hypothetical protein
MDGLFSTAILRETFGVRAVNLRVPSTGRDRGLRRRTSCVAQAGPAAGNLGPTVFWKPRGIDVRGIFSVT